MSFSADIAAHNHFADHPDNYRALLEQAQREVAEEDRRRQIDAIKTELRTYRPFWHRLFPWKITIERR